MTANSKYGGIFYIMDSNYNGEAVMPAASNSDRKRRIMVASTKEMVKLAFKDAGISLKRKLLWQA